MDKMHTCLLIDIQPTEQARIEKTTAGYPVSYHSCSTAEALAKDLSLYNLIFINADLNPGCNVIPLLTDFTHKFGPLNTNKKNNEILVQNPCNYTVTLI
jgi:hypothetical protein